MNLYTRYKLARKVTTYQSLKFSKVQNGIKICRDLLYSYYDLEDKIGKKHYRFIDWEEATKELRVKGEGKKLRSEIQEIMIEDIQEEEE